MSHYVLWHGYRFDCSSCYTNTLTVNFLAASSPLCWSVQWWLSAIQSHCTCSTLRYRQKRLFSRTWKRSEMLSRPEQTSKLTNTTYGRGVVALLWVKCMPFPIISLALCARSFQSKCCRRQCMCYTFRALCIAFNGRARRDSRLFCVAVSTNIPPTYHQQCLMSQLMLSHTKETQY